MGLHSNLSLFEKCVMLKSGKLTFKFLKTIWRLSESWKASWGLEFLCGSCLICTKKNYLIKSLSPGPGILNTTNNTSQQFVAALYHFPVGSLHVSVHLHLDESGCFFFVHYVPLTVPHKSALQDVFWPHTHTRFSCLVYTCYVCVPLTCIISLFWQYWMTHIITQFLLIWR
jgi:hypothetical protein